MKMEKKHQTQATKNMPSNHTQTQSSKMIGYNNHKIQTFPELTYSRRRKQDDKKNNNPESHKIQQKKLYIEKRTKMPVLIDGSKYPSTRTIGRSGSLSLLESLLNKSQVSPLEKQRRHYNFIHQNNIPVQKYQEKRQSKKMSFEVSYPKYRKIILDYEHHCDFNGNRQGKYYGQQNRNSERKKFNYKQNLFRESIDLNIENKSHSQRKPCLTRNQSSICLY